MERKIILEHIEVKGIRSIEVYRSVGGYSSVEKALKKMTPDEVTEQVINSGLRGRGGAGFPTGRKWSFIDKKSTNPRYLVCNADESEPGTFKDRYLMEHIPHRLIEGMISASYALGANTAYIYVRREFKYIIGILNQAIKEAYRDGFLGKENYIK